MRKISTKKKVPQELPDFKENTQISLSTFEYRPTHFAYRAVKGEVIVVFKNMDDEMPLFLITPWRNVASLAEEFHTLDSE